MINVACHSKYQPNLLKIWILVTVFSVPGEKTVIICYYLYYWNVCYAIFNFIPVYAVMEGEKRGKTIFFKCCNVNRNAHSNMSRHWNLMPVWINPEDGERMYLGFIIEARANRADGVEWRRAPTWVVAGRGCAPSKNHLAVQFDKYESALYWIKRYRSSRRIYVR